MALAGRPLVGCSAADIIAIFGSRHPDGRKFTPEELPPSRALAGEEAIDVPIAVTASDGRTVHVLATASPIRDDGGIVGALVVWQDVSALEAALATQVHLRYESEVRAEELETHAGELRQQGEELREHGLTLAESEEELREANLAATREQARVRNLLEIAGVMILALDTEGRVTLINRRGCEILGWPEEEILGKDWVENFLPERFRKDLSEAFRQVMAGEIAEFERNENPVLTRDGEERHVLWSNRSITDDSGRVTGILSSGEDITERMRVDDALRESEEELRLAQESARIGIWDWDTATGGVTISPGFLERYGLEPETMAHFTDWARIVYPDDLGQLQAAGQAALDAGEPIDHEFRVFLPSGDLRWIQFKGKGVADAPGTPLRMIGVLIDATDRKAAEIELARSAGDLRQSRQQLADVIAATGAGYYYVALGASDGTVSRRGAEILGFPPEEVPPVSDFGTWVRARVHPDDLEALLDSLAAFVAGETERNEAEFRVPTRDGGYRWVQAISTSVQRDEAGRVVTLAGFLFDIDERKRAEETLRRRLEEIETLMETVPVAIWVALDPACGEITGNRTANAFYEAREGENVSAGPPPGAPVPPRRFFAGGRELAAEELPMQVAAAHGVEVRDAELEVLLPSGGRIFMLGSASPLREASGAVRGCLGAFLDITKRKRAEEALRESEERLRLAQESANVAVWDWDLVTGAVTYSPEFLRFYGVTADAIRDYGVWRRLVHPEDVERVEAERQEAIARGEPFSVEFRVITPSGDVRWLAGIGRGIRDAHDRLVRVIGVHLDITERVEAMAERARIADDLRRSNEELQRFAYVASHDLQEPLRNIVSFSQLLERRCRGQLGPDADEYIAFIVEAGVRMQALIRDLLQLSRIETQAQPPVPIGAGAVVAGAVSTLEPRICETGATVTVGPMPTVMADPRQLEQVFVNLIGNAIKYGRPGVPPEVRVGAEREGRYWRFAVEDNGIGIAPEFFDRIFEMFSRLHTHDQYQGTGIGLAVVKKIVKRHGGTVRVESTPGEGTTFFFTLPAA